MIIQLIFLVHFFAFSHDVAIANFEISQDEDLLMLEVKIDKEDLENIYVEKDGEKIDLIKENKFVQEYLDKHFYLVVDRQKINFHLQDISKDNYFYSIKLTSENKIAQFINHIQLKNTCLIDTVDKHSNIVSFQLNDKYRTFRLHEGRIRVEVKY